MSPRFRHRLDRNHAACRQALEAMGWLFLDCSQTSLGFDAAIVKAGRVVFIEIKDGENAPSRQRLTAHEAKVHEALGRHGVRVVLVTCVEDLAQLDRQARGRYERG